MIPTTIHHVWVGGPLPDHLAAYVGSWDRHHPGWEHRLWTERDLPPLQNHDLYDRAPELVPVDAIGQLRSDIARYEILLTYGGLYVDCDTEALRPVDESLAGHDAWAAAEDANWVGNTYLACTPGHPVMRALVDGLAASVARNAGRRPNRMTGPRYLTPIWRAHGCHIARQRDWYPYSYADVKRGTVPASYGNAYAAHHWDHTRRVLAAR